ncbi:MAG: polysaccharide deacetylase family protein [Acidimicrobiales bacterium]|nr:polysaccharide deacetylase family protein [Acidimicrobiales bacterium]
MKTMMLRGDDPSTLLRQTAKNALIRLDSVVPTPADGVVTLAYHRVGRHTSSAVDLPREVFARQMAHVATRTDLLTLDAAARLLTPPHDPRITPNRQVVLTFDDGTSDFIDEVLPVLVELQLPATLFVATSFIDNQRSFPENGTPLTWNALRECVATGLVDVGAHSHTHLLLDRADDMTIDLELDVCNARIEDELGVTPSHFAYPKAVHGSTYADLAVRERYRTASIAGTRPNVVGRTDLWRLHRSPIQATDGFDGFLLKVNGGMRLEDDLRRAANKIRYRGKRS